MDNNKATIEDFQIVCEFSPEETNLPVSVVVLNRNSTYLPTRLYVSNTEEFGDDYFGMTVAKDPMFFGNVKLSPEDMEMVIDWMYLNWYHLIDIWANSDQLMNIDDLIDGFKKL